MSFLPFALSLSSTFTKIGAIAAFAALVGIAILSLLVFSQARELKRLREWAGRAPERAADLEQRVSSAAAIRVQQPPATQMARPVAAAMPAAGGATATRVVATPVAPGAAVPAGQAGNAAAVPGTPVAPAPGALPGTQPPAQPAPLQPRSPVPGAPAQPRQPGTSAPAAVPGHQALPGQPGGPARQPLPGAPASAPVGVPASAAAAAQSRPAAAAPAPGVLDPRAPNPAPATAAAAAGATAPRAPSPPPPALPPRPGEPPTSQSTPAAPVAPDPSLARRPLPPAPPVAPAAAPAPAVAQDVRARAASASTRQGIPPSLEGGRSVYAAKRSRGRMLALSVAAVVLVAAVVVVALTTLGGSSSPKHAASTVTTTASRTPTTHTKRSSHRTAKAAPKAPAVSPAETHVAVLNATEAEGLAHRTAIALQQNGYSQAEALTGKPPGSGQVSVVEYAGGHQAEAEGVARSESITHVLPVEAAVTALAGSANVVVIVGADKEHGT